MPFEPLVYRFSEIVQVYGLTLEEIIQEKLGDGITSAIDFSNGCSEGRRPEGDRVLITMNGKFLPYEKW